MMYKGRRMSMASFCDMVIKEDYEGLISTNNLVQSYSLKAVQELEEAKIYDAKYRRKGRYFRTFFSTIKKYKDYYIEYVYVTIVYNMSRYEIDERTYNCVQIVYHDGESYIRTRGQYFNPFAYGHTFAFDGEIKPWIKWKKGTIRSGNAALFRKRHFVNFTPPFNYQDDADYIDWWLKEPRYEIPFKLGEYVYIPRINELTNKQLYFLVKNKLLNHVRDMIEFGVYDIEFYKKMAFPYTCNYLEYGFTDKWDFIRFVKRLDGKFITDVYEDYIEFAKKLGIPITRKVFANKNYISLHDVYMEQVTEIENKELNEKIREVTTMYSKLECTIDGIAFILAKSSGELVKEGREMQHCVGSRDYDKKIADEKSLILFVRDEDSIEKAFVTMEFDLKYKEVRQLYAYHNSRPEERIEHIVYDKWLPKVEQLRI